MSAIRLAPEQVMVRVVDAKNLDRYRARLVTCLSTEDLARLDRYSNQAAGAMFLAARAALRLLLGQILATAPSEVQIATMEHGKPYLPACPQLFFNISHSRNIALIAIARHPVGIDVEFLRRPVDFAAVMRRFFSEDERYDWQLNSVPNPQAAFFRGWTRKEAILKATGEGIAGLGHTRVSFKPDEPRALKERLNDPSQSVEWLFNDFCPAPDYQAAVALKAPALQLTIEAFSMPGL